MANTGPKAQISLATPLLKNPQSFPTDKKEKSKHFAVDFKILHNQSIVASLPFFIHWTPLPLEPQSLFFEHTSYLVKNWDILLDRFRWSFLKHS